MLAKTIVPAFLFCLQPTAYGLQPPLPSLATQPLGTDADDPAIWIHPADPALSLILGTDKTKAPKGGLAVFDLQGKIVQRIGDLDRPNNVDVEYGFALKQPDGSTRKIDIAVLTERFKHRLRVYSIDPATRTLADISDLDGLKVFADDTGEAREPMGIAIYKRPTDSAVFAIVSRAAGPKEGYLAQYRLLDNGTGKAMATLVRTFGRFSGVKEIESLAVDDELGYVYASDETVGVRKYRADPDVANANEELALFGTTGFAKDQEGIALWCKPGGKGYIVVSDQGDEDNPTRVHLFPREGTAANPHEHPDLGSFSTGATETDGIEIAAVPLGANFPAGLLAVMNDRDKNFLLIRLDAIREPTLARP